jgi:RimJ/RimL family protein N-acetyltransferase
MGAALSACWIYSPVPDILSFRKPTPDDARLILDWRTAPHVASYMLSKIDYDLEKQRAWLGACENRSDYHHRLIVISDKPVGYTSLTITDPDTGIGEVGAYIGDVEAPRALTAFNFISTLNHAFYTLKLFKIVNHIIGFNERIVRAQRYNNYRHVGVLRQQVRLGEVLADLHIFEQFASDWALFRTRYKDKRDWDGIIRQELPVQDLPTASHDLT